LKHLTPEDIQRYLDGVAGRDTGEFDDHLAGCPGCLERLEEYRALYVDLGDDGAIPALPGLTDKVMNRLISGRRSEEESGLLDFVLAGCGILLAAVALIVFVGLGPLTAGPAWLGGAIRDLAGAGASAASRLRPPVLLAAAAVIFLVYIANGIALRRPGTRSPRP